MTMRTLRLRLTLLAATAAWLVAAGRGAAAAAPPPPGSPAPNFALTTQLEDRLWLAELRGRAVILAFGCTKCGTCPGVLDRLAEIGRGLGNAPGRHVVFALVTVDPAHDTPAVLRAFGRARGLGPPSWVFFTQERTGEVDLVAARYGIEIRRAVNRIEAGCTVTVIDAGGAIRGRYEAGALDGLRRDLRALLSLPAE
jgi:protein SCO1/2